MNIDFNKPILKLLKEYKGYSLYKRFDEGIHESYEIHGANITSCWIKKFDPSLFEKFIDTCFEANKILGRNEH